MKLTRVAGQLKKISFCLHPRADISSTRSFPRRQFILVRHELRNELRNEKSRNAFVFLVIHGRLISFYGIVGGFLRRAADVIR